MTSTATVSYKLSPGLKPPEVDNIEKLLILIDKREVPLEVETEETSLGLS